MGGMEKSIQKLVPLLVSTTSHDTFPGARHYEGFDVCDTGNGLPDKVATAESIY